METLGPDGSTVYTKNNTVDYKLMIVKLIHISLFMSYYLQYTLYLYTVYHDIF